MENSNKKAGGKCSAQGTQDYYSRSQVLVTADLLGHGKRCGGCGRCKNGKQCSKFRSVESEEGGKREKKQWNYNQFPCNS